MQVGLPVSSQQQQPSLLVPSKLGLARDETIWAKETW
jgi:hypothetical protein